MIHGAIFDVDGTLLDSMPYWHRTGDLYLKSIGVQARPGIADIMFPMTLSEAAQYLKKEYDLPLTQREIMDGIHRTIQDFYLYHIQPKAGIPELLAAFQKRKIPMIVATVTDHKLVQAALERTGIASYFCQILTTTEVGAGKYHPDIFLRSAEILHSKPSETLVFEDALHAMRTAKGAGFVVVGVYDFYSASAQEAIQTVSDYYLRSYSDPDVTAMFRAISTTSI